jgi:SCP-2 sterol transfer family
MHLLLLITTALALPVQFPWKLAVACMAIEYPQHGTGEEVAAYYFNSNRLPDYCNEFVPKSVDRSPSNPFSFPASFFPTSESASPESGSPETQVPSPEDPFRSAQIFDSNSARMSSDPKIFKQFAAIGAVFRVYLTKSSEKRSWLLNFRDGNAQVREVPVDAKDVGVKVDATVETSDDDFVQLAEGKLSGFKGYLLGRIKYAGPKGPAVKLNYMFAALRTTKK